MTKPHFSAADLNAAVDQGWVTRRRHPDMPLYIYNYTLRTVFEGAWWDLTEQCRGLILDRDHNIVSRPFRKFFSVAEWTEKLKRQIPNEPFEVFDKLDGSLGISYWQDGKLRIATRGSFESEQAKAANGIAATQFCCKVLDPTLTYLFEIIYPDNRYVVNYGDLEALVLLAVFETESGREIPIDEFAHDLKVAQSLPPFKAFGSIKRYLDNTRNVEGGVVRFKSGLRLKVKAEEYKRLFKIIVNTNTHTVWEALKDGCDADFLLNDKLPEHHVRFVKETAGVLARKHNAIENEVLRLFDMRPKGRRKDISFYFRGTLYPAILFALLDDKWDLADELIWKLVEPRGNDAANVRVGNPEAIPYSPANPEDPEMDHS